MTITIPHPDPLEGQEAKLVNVIHAVGRTRYLVRCPCAGETWIFLWSWAGHGKARCQVCKRWIDYTSHRVSFDRNKIWRPLQ